VRLPAQPPHIPPQPSGPQTLPLQAGRHAQVPRFEQTPPSSRVSTLAPPPVHAPGHAALGEASAEPVVFVAPTMISVAPWGRLEDRELFARARYVEWAVRMIRTWGFDVLTCPRCPRKMRVVATITQPDVVRKMLDHLGARASPLPRDPAWEQTDLGFEAERTNKPLNADVYEFGNLKFWFTRKDGSIFQDQHLSYGQKRLLTFLYYLEANPSIVIADELVNGLHHAWIKECMEAIGERQAFLTSQNPLLLDYLFFTSLEEVKESFILCRTEPVGDSEKMIWRNLTDDEAAMFYSAYKVGIEHVGEILRTRGLW
jgi:hypothetical protein